MKSVPAKKTAHRTSSPAMALHMAEWKLAVPLILRMILESVSKLGDRRTLLTALRTALMRSEERRVGKEC